MRRKRKKIVIWNNRFNLSDDLWRSRLEYSMRWLFWPKTICLSSLYVLIFKLNCHFAKVCKLWSKYIIALICHQYTIYTILHWPQYQAILRSKCLGLTRSDRIPKRMFRPQSLRLIHDLNGEKKRLGRSGIRFWSFWSCVVAWQQQ